MSTCTTCPYCGVGCGVVARTDGQRVIAVEGDPEHPANFGRLCVKGSALADTTELEGRLLQPRVDGIPCGWDTAMGEMTQRLQSIIREHGPDSVAMYLSGQLLTEDYYVANKLMKGFIGSPHIDTNSRLCMASTVAGYKRAFGADAQPCNYEDLELADLIVLVGSNAAWNHPIVFQRIQQSRIDNPNLKIVLIDPRKTATADIADLHLKLRPGSDTALFNGLLDYLNQRDRLDWEFINQHTVGFKQSLAAAQNCSDWRSQVDCDAGAIETFFEWFTDTPKTLTLFSQGVNQSSQGTDKVNALINCHLATGRIGRPGMGPFSLTGQPNAMGGREVGGLANQLAAHMDPSDPDHLDCVERFWHAPNMINGPGLKAIELFEGIESGRIKAVWIMATNPTVSLPDVERLSDALAQCPLVVVSDCMERVDTLAYADIVLPATGWSEKDGTVTNSERRISRQAALVPAPSAARHDWQIICDLASRLGYADAFNYSCPADIFREHARLSAFENQGQRLFNLAGLTDISNEEYQHLKPIQWPVDRHGGTERLFANHRFVHPDGRARFVPVVAASAQQQPRAEYPLIVNSGRVRDHWHTMTRTGRSARLNQHRPEPFIQIHPNDAQRFDLKEHQLAVLTGTGGRFIGRAQITDEQRPGEVFIPMHWSRQFAADALCGRMFDRSCDPLSGQPESKHGVGRIAPFPAQWEARLLMTRHTAPATMPDVWTRVEMDRCTSYRMAGTQHPENWETWCQTHLGAVDLHAWDPRSQNFRAAGVQDGQLSWVLLVGCDEHLPDLDWLDSCFGQALSPETRTRLLSASSGDPRATGPVICSCYQVKAGQIEHAIQQGVGDAKTLGQQLKCGTNCGSCVPELNALLQRYSLETVDA